MKKCSLFLAQIKKLETVISNKERQLNSHVSDKTFVFIVINQIKKMVPLHLQR